MQKLAKSVVPDFSGNTLLAIDLFHCGRQMPHYHENTMEMILCLSGQATVHSMHQKHELLPGGMIQADMFDIHTITSDEDNLMASFHINLDHPLFSGQGYDLLYYICSSDDVNEVQKQQLPQLRLLLLSLLACHMHDPQHPDVQDLTGRLMMLLREHFQYYDHINVDPEMYPRAMKDRFERIMAYMLDHYADKLTMRDVCNMEHISYNYLSRFFKDSSLMTFRNFLHEIRVYYSEHLLLCEPELSIQDISYRVGFSDPKIFFREFKKKHGHTPHQHRIWYRRYNQSLTPDGPVDAAASSGEIERCVLDLLAKTVAEMPQY